MSNYSIFDIAGPIMVGPSSSHTAGACKIGQYARALFHETPEKVTFYLHGSFGEVYKGHATDRALLGGVMKFRTSDPRIKDSFEIADEKKLKYEFIPKDLGADCHPNTVKIVLQKGKYKMEVTGSSIGGGMIEINKVDNFKINLTGVAGKYLSVVICHKNDSKLINAIVDKFKKLETPVAKIDSVSFKDETLSVFSLEGKRITKNDVEVLEKIEGIDFVRALSRLDK